MNSPLAAQPHRRVPEGSSPHTTQATPTHSRGATTTASCRNLEDSGSLGSGNGLNVSATYLMATFGGAPAYYSLWLGQPCTSSVVVHLLLAMDSLRSMKVSSNRICFTPENYQEPQLVRIEVMDNHSHSNVISHRVFSLDRSYDRISTPNVVVKALRCGIGSLLTLGGLMSKRKAAAVGSKTTRIDMRKAIPHLGSPATPCGVVDPGGRLQDPPWFVSHLASGNNFSLAVVTHQTTMVFAWGVNSNGELGLSSATSTAEPQLITALPMQMHGELIGVMTVSCGKHHAALVTTQAKLLTWGNNKYGQLGHGDYTNRLAPQEVHFALATLSSNQRALRIKHTILERGGTNVTHAACGAFHTLFVTHQQNVLAMGYNQAGQLGIGHRLQQHKGWRSGVPIAVESLRGRSILDIAAGQNHSACVLSNGDVYVWGCGDDGRLGVGKSDCEMLPVLIPSFKDSGIKARSVRCGARHTAVISDRDLLYMWGANEFGQLGCGDKRTRLKPCLLTFPAFLADGVVDVALGEFHSVCVTHKGEAFAWGLDLGGEESAQIDQRSSPTLVALPDGERAQKVSCGWTHTNIVTQTLSDSIESPNLLLPPALDASSNNRHPTTTAATGSSSAWATNFHRNIEKKQVAQRRDELSRWRTRSAPWGLSTDPNCHHHHHSSSSSHHGVHGGAWQRKKSPPMHAIVSGNMLDKTLATKGERSTCRSTHSNHHAVEEQDGTPEQEEAERSREAIAVVAFVTQLLERAVRNIVAQNLSKRLDTVDR